MRKRNQRLVILFFGLLLVNLAFLFFDGKSSSVSFDEELFTINDTSTIEQIVISSPKETISLGKSASGWKLNETQSMDEGLRRLLLSILQRVEVKKPVDIEVPPEKITVSIQKDDPKTFYVWGNAMRTKTFFSKDESSQVYEVGIPGYNEFLGGIFYLTTDQWKDRLIVDASWRTIQELNLDYQEDSLQDLTIRFSDEFFEVSGINELDSNAVVSYLNQFQYFEANERISPGRFERYDSLSKKPPLATLSLLTIDLQQPLILDIFPKLAGEQYYLVADSNHNLLIIDQKRIGDILKNPSDLKSAD